MHEPDRPQLSLKEVRRIAKEMESVRDSGPLLKISTASFIAGLHADTVRRWVRSGRIRSWGFRGSLRVRVADLLPERDRDDKESQ